MRDCHCHLVISIYSQKGDPGDWAGGASWRCISRISSCSNVIAFFVQSQPLNSSPGFFHFKTPMSNPKSSKKEQFFLQLPSYGERFPRMSGMRCFALVFGPSKCCNSHLIVSHKEFSTRNLLHHPGMVAMTSSPPCCWSSVKLILQQPSPPATCSELQEFINFWRASPPFPDSKVSFM